MLPTGIRYFDTIILSPTVVAERGQSNHRQITLISMCFSTNCGYRTPALLYNYVHTQKKLCFSDTRLRIPPPITGASTYYKPIAIDQAKINKLIN